MKNWLTLPRGYLFSQPTSYNKFHLGLDVIPKRTLLTVFSYLDLIAWQDLEVVHSFWGAEGGNTIFIKCKDNKRLFRCMHLAKKVLPGKFKEGSKVATIGNTGSLSKGVHLHIDISKDGILNLINRSNFENPELYFKMVNGVK